MQRARRRDFPEIARLVGYAALAAMVASPQLIAKALIIGWIFDAIISTNYMRWDAPFFWETVFATRNGLFVWTPLAYIGVAGLLAARRGTACLLGGALLLGFLGEMWVNGSAYAWWSDFSFSNRRFVDCTIVIAIGLAFLFERRRDLAVRWARLAPATAITLLLAPLVVFNIELAWAVKSGQQRNAEPPSASPISTAAASTVSSTTSRPPARRRRGPTRGSGR